MVIASAECLGIYRLVADAHRAWTGHAPPGSFKLEAVAWYEGNRKFGSARSNVATVLAPPIIR